MVAPSDIANRALSEIGSRTLISSFTESSPAAAQCRLQYDAVREQVLRAAPWGFTRKTVTLTTLGQLLTTPPGSPYPWLNQYLYPPDCIKFRYILVNPAAFVTTTNVPDVSVARPLFVPWTMPNRAWRFTVAMDDSTTPPRRVLLSNVPSAIGVYTANVEDPDLWDPLFTDAFVMALANKLVIPLSGNVQMKQQYAQLAEQAILKARVADANEALPRADVTVDWMVTRGIGYGGFNGVGAGVGYGVYDGWGQCYSGYDDVSWSM